MGRASTKPAASSPAAKNDIRQWFGKPAPAHKPAPQQPAPATAKTSDVEVDLTADVEEAAPPKRQKVAASKSPAASAKVKAEPKTEPKAEPKAEPKTEPKAKPKGKGKASGDKRKRGRKIIDAKADGEEDDESFEVSPGTGVASASESLEVELDDDYAMEVDEESKPAQKAASRKRKSRSETSEPASQAKKTPAKKTSAKRTGAKNTPGTAKKATTKGKKKEASEEPETAAAIAAVDAAALLLPPEEGVKFTRLPEQAAGGYGGGAGGDAVEPPNHGTKTYPQGHPECLKGKRFVISGTLDSLFRHEATDLIQKHSGRVTGSVSGSTSFLLCGENTGNSKYNKAQEKGVKLIDEEGLLSLLSAAPAPAVPAGGGSPGASAPSKGASAAPSAAPAAPAPAPPTQGPAGKAASAGPSPRPSMAAGPSSSKAVPASSGQLWVETHKPGSAKELVGNPGAIGNLRIWLRNWEKTHMQGQSAPEAKGAAKSKKDLGKKAVLISGPPGIGKTSSAMIICRELGFVAVEVNASDTRNKSDKSALKGVGGRLSNSIREMATNASLNMNVEQAKADRDKMVLVMDEVDGMSGGDRGGVTDLIDTIKRSKVPIIAICNDKYNQKLKSLRNHCLELEYRKPTKDQIMKRMKTICEAEGLQVTDSTLMALAEGANCDIRLVLGQLQMVRLRARALSYDEVKGKLGTSKDADMSPFDAARKLLETSSMHLSMSSRTDLVFQDDSLVPLLVQENYLNHRPAPATDDRTRLKFIAKAADLISDGDLVNRQVRQKQNWGLMPFAAIIGSVAPGVYMRGVREIFGLYPGEANFPRFPVWLGQNSSAGKQRRLLGELHTRMASSGAFQGDRSALRLSYLPVLQRTLLAPLAEHGKEGIEAVVEEMHGYCLARDDVDFLLDVTKFKTKQDWGEDPMKEVDTQTKSAFTRYFNTHKVRARTGTEADPATKKKKGRAAAQAVDETESQLDGGDPEMEPELTKESPGKSQKEEEEEEEDELDPLMLAKKAKQLARRGMSFNVKETGTKGKRGGGRGGRGAARGGGRGRGTM